MPSSAWGAIKLAAAGAAPATELRGVGCHPLYTPHMADQPVAEGKANPAFPANAEEWAV